MKHCLKSDPEPDCLASFRPNHPQGTWEEFRDTQCYRTIRDTTHADQGGLCAYCERLLPEIDRQIAHFHPKSDTNGGVRWAFHWPNLWFACSGGNQTSLQNPASFLPPPADNLSCDVPKEDRVVDGQVLSPADVPSFPRVFRYEQYPDAMKIVPDDENCTAAGITSSLAQASIDTFNLNCRRLTATRIGVHRAIEKQIKRIHEHSSQPEADFRAFAQRRLTKDADGHWPQFFTMIRWRFRESAETYLRSINYQG